MEIGVVLPQGEIVCSASELRAYCATTENLGYRHVVAYDHVLGTDPVGHPNWTGKYTVADPFHEPLVLFGFLAAITSMELVTGVLVLPQRQTALVAKQASEVDRLSNGRLRLGVGIGWNRVEYDALGRDFATRGARIEEQVRLLRELWTQGTVTFTGVSEKVIAAGLAPLPVQRPIPVWLGGGSPVAYRRIGQIADGWFPRLQPGPELDDAIRTITASARDCGRSEAVGMHGRTQFTSAEQVAESARRWHQAGATHLSVNTLGLGLTTLADHLAVLTVAASALGISDS